MAVTQNHAWPKSMNESGCNRFQDKAFARVRRLISCVLSCCTLSLCGFARAEKPNPRFDVAAVRPTSRDELAATIGQATYSGLTISGSRINIGGLPMSILISTAFRVNPRLIVGVPLMSDSLFSVQAIMPVGATKDELPEMLRALLEDRFHLKVHQQIMEQSGYALVAGKGAFQLNRPRQVDFETCSPWTDDPRVPGGKLCLARSPDKTVSTATDSDWGPIETVSSSGIAREEYFRISMATLAIVLATHLSNQSDTGTYIPVADRTGISGEWDLVLERADPLSMRQLSGREAFQTYDPFEAYSAALVKVGLRLQKASVRIEELVVDHVDQLPTDN
jgi:uncharacterized protein (TIGR03435 family)